MSETPNETPALPPGDYYGGEALSPGETGTPIYPEGQPIGQPPEAFRSTE